MSTEQDTRRLSRLEPSAAQRAAERENTYRAALSNAACSMESSATAFEEMGQPGQAQYLRGRAREARSALNETLYIVSHAKAA